MSAPLVTSPTALPSLRLWLLDQWREGRPYGVAAALHHTERARLHNVPSALLTKDYSVWERRALEQATLWWVSADMVDVLTAAYPTMPDDVKVTDLPRPSTSGLVVLEKPWFGVDANQPGGQVQVNGFVWGVARLPPTNPAHSPDGELAIGVSTYRRVEFGDGLTAHELQMATSMGAVQHAVQHRTGAGTIILTGSTWLPLGRSDWPLPDPLGLTPWPMRDNEAASFVEDRRMLGALWSLLAQRLTEQTTVAADRPTRRRTERAGVAPALAEVRVIRLRASQRTTDASPATPGRHLGCRFIVQPHFVWQPYGPGRSLRKLIVRGPFTKGPPGAPLRKPKVVRAWTR